MGSDWLDQILEERREEERIRCPYCETVQTNDFCDWDTHLITYWGEGQEGANINEIECEKCERAFRVRENVRRTFDTVKLGARFDYE